MPARRGARGGHDELGRNAYRFHQSKPIPVAISLIVRDVLHNLRSALDSLMVGLVRLDLGRELDEADEKACQFPISRDPKAFKEDLRRPKARGLVTERLEASLREAQPSPCWRPSTP